MHKVARLVWLGVVCAMLSSAQKPLAGVPTRVTITLGHSYGMPLGDLKAEDLTVTHDLDKLLVLGLTKLRGEEARLELYVVVDNCSSCEVGAKFDELSRFLTTRSASTDIGVAYIQDGKLQIALKPSRDHKRAIEALNAPEGSKPASPFPALTQLIETWPANSARHAVLIVSNGVDPNVREAAANKPAEDTIRAAERAGVVIYSIYHPAADYATAEFTPQYVGQIELAHVAEESGGESYFLGMGPLPSLAPFLADIADHLANQYILEFIANPEDGPGTFQEITVKSKTRDVEIMSPERVWVPGRGADDLRKHPGNE